MIIAYVCTFFILISGISYVFVYRQGIRDGKLLREGGNLKNGIFTGKKSGGKNCNASGGWDDIMNYDHNTKQGKDYAKNNGGQVNIE